MILLTILIVIIVLLLGMVAYILIGKLYKDTRKNVKDGIHFSYHLIPRKLDMPSYTLSPYFNRYPDKKSRWTPEFWNICPTIDDPWLKELAQEVDKACEGKSDRYKAGYILKIAQCIYTYESDKKVYNETDRWQFPVCTAYLRHGDCEDGAFIGAGLSLLCGLDTIVIYEEGHALYGVNVKGFGMRVKHKDASYLKCETTAILPLGITLSGNKVLGTYNIYAPAKDFIKSRTFIDQYDKYKS